MITDKGIVDGICGSTELGPYLTDGLKLLSIFGNTLVTQNAPHALASSSSKQSLKTLDLNGCKQISEDDRHPDNLRSLFPKCETFIYHS